MADKTYFAACGLASSTTYALLSWLSFQFATDVPKVMRPTIWMLALFAVEFIAYAIALRLAVQLPPTRALIRQIVFAACLFRAILLPSVPMHEIDIYRYIWDGEVVAAGVNPYRYAPQQVLEAVQVGTADEPLKRLVALQARSESLAQTLSNIHYGELPSPYPAVSQALFAVAAIVSPDGVGAHTRMVIMKIFLTLFDIATLLVVIALVRDVGLHPAWSIAYGWCPLVLKETANGGHLDAIAIFLTTLAVWLLVRTCRTGDGPTAIASALTGAVLALAIGAKLYPLVLLPLFAALWWRRGSGASAMVGLLSTLTLSGVLLYPLLQPGQRGEPPEDATPTVAHVGVPGQVATPITTPTANTLTAPSAGISTFFDQWEMNDLIFMVVLENLRPQAEVEPRRRPWFAVVPDRFSEVIVSRWTAIENRLGDISGFSFAGKPLTPRRASFHLARVLTGGTFALFACLWAWQAAGVADPRRWCRAGMLTLAWFWLTCPTQNPWYWCWVLPLLPFARYRTWYFVAAATMLYYLRFWLTAHFPDPPLLGTRYDGEYFFYFVVPWIAFVPCLLGLAYECVSGGGHATPRE